MNEKAIQEALLIADAQSSLKHQMIVVYTIRDLCRRLKESDQIIDQRNAELSAKYSQPAAQQTCNCRWEGETQVQECTLHEAHVAAIHEWAERAKAAEAKLKQRAAWVGLTDEEITNLHHEIKVQLMGSYKTVDLYRAIEAKLKEKNNGI